MNTILDKNIFIILAILGGIMMFTNPSKDDYVEYSATHLCTASKNVILNASCQGLVLLQRDNVKHLIDVSTTKTNLLFLSIYTTSILGVKVDTVGFLGNFFPYHFAD